MTMIRRRPIVWMLVASAALWGPTVHADGLAALESFLRQTQQGRAAFTQTITVPAKVGESAPRSRVSRGTFEFQRPDRFRFVYTHPFEQTIVADGTTVWLYDADLNQVTTRAQQEVLAQTPAALIASSADLRAVAQAFDLRPAPDSDGLSWVTATPKQADGQIQRVQLGFRQGQLAALEVLDSFGQRSAIRFESMNTQPGFGPAHFQFQPPAGADVIRQ